jgi:hypothetical protein
MLSKYAELIVCLFIWSSALAGPFRYVSAMVGFPVYLLPKALLLLLIIRSFVLLRANLILWLIAVGIGFSCYVGLMHHLAPAQVAFGFWALLPFFFGLFFPEVVFSERVRRGMYATFAICVVGEIASYFTVFPWSGMSLDVGGVSTIAAREWSTGSARRLAGFSTSSIDLSLMLGICGILFMFRSRQFLTRLILFCVAAALILATTMKTALLAFVLACLPLLISSRFLRTGAAITGLVFLALGTVIPFYLNTNVFLISQIVRLGSQFETIRERFEVTWPAVLDYLRHAGAGLWGMGLGSLGSATAVGANRFDYASVDNVYLYALGTGGLLGLAILFIFAKRICSEGFGSGSGENREVFSLPLIVFFAIYGFTQPLVEASVGALFFAAVLVHRRRRIRIVARVKTSAPHLDFLAG